MKSSRIELRTRLTPAECAARISASIDAEPYALMSLASLFGSRPIIGWARDSSFSLRKRLAYRNSFQSFLTASMQQESGITVISGKVAMHPFIQVFLCIWFGVLMLIDALMFATLSAMLLGAIRFQESAWIGVAILSLMLLFGCSLVWIGRFFARDEARFLTDFLIEALEAQELKRAD